MLMTEASLHESTVVRAEEFVDAFAPRRVPTRTSNPVEVTAVHPAVWAKALELAPSANYIDIWSETEVVVRNHPVR
jgi:hypothetical protein